MTIRVLVPAMPDPDQLMPYLRRMHGRRVYVNGGPLVEQLEERLQAATGLPTRMVSNGTMAIQLALQALGLPPRSRILVPAVTFSGTALAIQNAGHVPVLSDVQPQCWQMNPGHADGHDVDAAVPVAAFGMPLDIGPWVAWAEAMNKPVVVDAAGALLDQPTCQNPRVVFAYSLHATKFIGAGEGGAVASANTALLGRVASLANFGHSGGTNAKMSEYHAAVAHASIDGADERATRMLRVRHRYIARLLRSPAGVQLQRPGVQLNGWLGAPSMMPVLLPEKRHAMAVMMGLDERGIETRQWYRPFLSERVDMGVHSQLGDWLPVTRTLIERLIGLPMHAHMTIDDVDHVCVNLEAVCGY